MGEKFTWFPKFTAALTKVPPEHRGDLAWAIILYGTDVVEPDIDWPFDAIFEGLREDIDNSRNARSRNGGGRPPKKAHDGENNSGCDDEKPPFPDEETTVSGDGEAGFGDAEPKPSQSKPVQANPGQVKGGSRFRAPTPDEVREYSEEKGLAVDPERFCDYYASKGWKVGRSPMKDWKATARNWARRNDGKEAGNGAGGEYSSAF